MNVTGNSNFDGRAVSELTCFKAYDIRGELGVNLDAGIAYRVGRAAAQHLGAGSVVLGRDARESSPELAAAVARGVTEAGCDVLDIGLAGTEEMYWAVTEFGAAAGIEVTASHNPVNYNGMKIVKAGSRPLDDAGDFRVIKGLAETRDWAEVNSVGRVTDISGAARAKYVEKVLSFVDAVKLRPTKVVVNSGNGAAGPTFDAIAGELERRAAPLEFVRVHHDPDHTFPNGIPNPLLPENHAATRDAVRAAGADFGVAFDGDFDRCFLFDERGDFIPGEYVVGLLASKFLRDEAGARVVHDPRVIWNTLDVVESLGGAAVQSKTGHAFVKRSMREAGAIYGGEMSAHHYFRDFAFCDSGMIPWLVACEIVSRSGASLGELIRERREKFPSSGEINFRVEDADAAIARVREQFAAGARVGEADGLSLSFEDWRLNVRKSNTEPLVRLNVEALGRGVDLDAKIEAVTDVLLI